jgi:hypothetical protein
MRLIQKNYFLHCLLVGFFFVAVFFARNVQGKEGQTQKEIKKTGTFSSLYYDWEDTGDLNGVEIRIVKCGRPGDIGYQGTIQFAEGVPFRLNLIKDIRFGPDNQISFSFNIEDGSSITFKGQISEKAIKGTFSNGFWKPINLKRTKSYWE